MQEPQCPRCGKDFVQRIHRRWGMERLVSLIYIYPFRCQLCGHRFRAQQWGMRYVRHTIDRRQYERMATTFPVTFAGETDAGEGTVLDISMGGCGVGTVAQLSEGMLLQLQLQASPDTPAISVETAVVRSVRSRFVGLEFLRLAPPAKERLSQLIYELLEAHQYKV